MTPALLYIHGFNSSPQSAKARLIGADLARMHPGVHYLAPALPPNADAAIAMLEQILVDLHTQNCRPLLVGSSLGGFFATVLAERHHLRAVLINPAVRPWLLFKGHLGPQQNLYTSERWELTLAHVEALRALEVPQLSQPQNFLVLLQTGDETLDWQQAADFYRDCSLCKQLGGDHSFAHLADWLPIIYRFGDFPEEGPEEHPK